MIYQNLSSHFPYLFITSPNWKAFSDEFAPIDPVYYELMLHRTPYCTASLSEKLNLMMKFGFFMIWLYLLTLFLTYFPEKTHFFSLIVHSFSLIVHSFSWSFSYFVLFVHSSSYCNAEWFIVIFLAWLNLVLYR